MDSRFRGNDVVYSNLSPGGITFVISDNDGANDAMTRILYDLAGANDLRFSPNCWRSRMALAHKGLDVACEPVRFTDKDKIAFSNQKLVPVLRDGDKVVCESWPIACYLEEMYPDRPSLFSGPDGKHAMNFINDWANDTLHPAMVRTIVKDIFGSIDPADRDYFRESREKRFGMTLEALDNDREANFATLRSALAPLNGTLGDQRWICGIEPAYGDYVVFGAFQWARAVSPMKILEPDEPLYGWRERMLDMFDGLGRTVPERAA